MSLRWALLWLAALALILIPFFLLEERVERLPDLIANWQAGRWIAGGAIAGLLALDILLPVPSSVLSTAAGAMLGFVPGAFASLIGMTAGCVLGHWLGRRSAQRFIDAGELARVSKASSRLGPWVVVVFRAVPVLAEASVFFAGVTGMPRGRFLTLAAASNLGISAVYAAVGAYAVKAESFLLAFAGAIIVPLVAMLIARSARIGNST